MQTLSSKADEFNMGKLCLGVVVNVCWFQTKRPMSAVNVKKKGLEGCKKHRLCVFHHQFWALALIGSGQRGHQKPANFFAKRF